MPEASLQVICFSKGRPLQLHGYLSSLFAHHNYVGELRVKVLASIGPKWFADAYEQVEKEFPQVEWRHERDFRTDLLDLIGDTEYTMFGCDDVVFTRAFGGELLGEDEIGFSLRLGKHITRDMFGSSLPQPDYGQFMRWHVEQACGDWGYPWEVLGTVYRTDFVKRMVARIQPTSPSQLEARGAVCWPVETAARMLTSRALSCLVVPTVNVVQQEYPNGICGEIPLHPGFLMECWDHGLRLDVDRYVGIAPESWRIPDFHLRRVA